MTILTVNNYNFKINLTTINQQFINKASIINTTQLNIINGESTSQHININEEVITFRHLFKDSYTLANKIEMQEAIINSLQNQLDSIDKGLYLVKQGARVGQLFIKVNKNYNAREIKDNNGVWYLKGEFNTTYLNSKKSLVLKNNANKKASKEELKYWSDLLTWEHNPENSQQDLINKGLIRDNIKVLYYIVNDKDIDIIPQYQTFNIDNINNFFKN